MRHSVEGEWKRLPSSCSYWEKNWPRKNLEFRCRRSDRHAINFSESSFQRWARKLQFLHPEALSLTAKFQMESSLAKPVGYWLAFYHKSGKTLEKGAPIRRNWFGHGIIRILPWKWCLQGGSVKSGAPSLSQLSWPIAWFRSLIQDISASSLITHDCDRTWWRKWHEISSHSSRNPEPPLFDCRQNQDVSVGQIQPCHWRNKLDKFVNECMQQSACWI